MGEEQKKLLTLVVIYQHPNILLGMKKRGFGAGRWNGFGGKVNQGESVIDAAKRELFEEVRVVADALDHVGVLDFEFKGDPQILQVHIFKGDIFSGEPKETEEMKPQWFNVDALPFDTMWVDDKHWFPYFLAGKKFRGTFLYEGTETILDAHITEV